MPTCLSIGDMFGLSGDEIGMAVSLAAADPASPRRSRAHRVAGRNRKP
jgi:2-methylcitrate dehydratase PrpD